MTLRTPVSQIKKLKKGTKASPPLGSIRLQSSRPNIQQARDSTSLELFEPSPEQQSRSQLEVAVRPKWQELRGETSPEVNKNRHLRAVTRRPLTTFGVFSCSVLSIASLHLIYFGHLSFDRMDSRSNVSTKNRIVSDNRNYFRSSSSHQLHAKGPPRIICIGNHLDNTTPTFIAEVGRNVVLYPAKFSDVTQLYDRKDDDEIEDSVEMKSFPLHETDKDCVPMSPWQTLSFRTS